MASTLTSFSGYSRLPVRSIYNTWENTRLKSLGYMVEDITGKQPVITEAVRTAEARALITAVEVVPGPYIRGTHEREEQQSQFVATFVQSHEANLHRLPRPEHQRPRFEDHIGHLPLQAQDLQSKNLGTRYMVVFNMGSKPF